MHDPFDTFIGNETAAGFMQSVVRSGAPSHAYLLTGPDGTGKRTLAKMVAAGLVCELQKSPPNTAKVPALTLGLDLGFDLDLEQAPSVAPAGERTLPDETARPIPCGRCRACMQVDRDSHPDVRLVAPESGKRGIVIKQVRELEHDAGLRPYQATRKVFILTRVEDMVLEAANALLKTLEEPPGDTVLLLTAADASQVLPTIASRCQEITLRPVPAQQIEMALRGRGVECDRATLLARLAGGRPGWALAAITNEPVLEAREERLAQLESLLRLPPVERLPAAGTAGDAAAARELLDTWAGWWRDALLVRCDCDDLVTNLDHLEQLRRRAPPAEVCRLSIRRVQEARRQIDGNVNVRLAIEGLLLDLPQCRGA